MATPMSFGTVYSLISRGRSRITLSLTVTGSASFTGFLNLFVAGFIATGVAVTTGFGASTSS